MAYHPKSMRVLGIAQMILGSVMFVLGIFSIVFVPYWNSFIACGLWVGIWVFLTGLFGYLGAKNNDNPNNCLIGIMIGFAVTSMVLAGSMLTIQSIALAQFGQRLRCPKNPYDIPTPAYNNWQYNECDRYSYRSYNSYFIAQKGAAIGSLLLILAIVEFFVALVSSIYGCNSCNCCATTQPRQQVAYIQQPGGHFILVSPGSGIPPGAAMQTISAQPGQAIPSGQPQQQYVVPPQGYPEHTYQQLVKYPAGATVNKPEDFPDPSYSTVAQ